MNLRLTLCLVPVVTALAGCEWHVVEDHAPSGSASTSGAHGAPPGAPGERAPSSAPPQDRCGIEVNRWKELLVINRSVLSDRRAGNDTAGAPWSFRSRMEELAGSSDEAPALVQAWLAEWTSRTSVGEGAAPVTPRPSVDAVIVAPWRQSLPGSTDYGTGSAPLPLDRAPFRLVAIVNRLDLREVEGGCEGSAGELRFVYTALDPTTRLAKPFSVIVEVPYPTTRSPREWAQQWHDAAQRPFGADYNESLAALTTEVTSKATRASIRVRTNEIALGEPLSLPWEMREFSLDGAQPARLVQVPLLTTPRIELQRSPSLDAWTKDNAAQVLAGTHVLPAGLQAGAAPMASPFFRWPTTTVSEELRHALSIGTCNGCHGGERPAGDPLRFQHLAPGDTTAAYYPTTNGETQVSRYLNDPAGNEDELGRRGRVVASMLCGSCSPSVPPATDAGYHP